MAIAFQQRSRIRVCICGNLMRTPIERCSEPSGQIKDHLKLGEQVLDLAQLLYLIPPQLQLRFDCLTPLCHTLCMSKVSKYSHEA